MINDKIDGFFLELGKMRKQIHVSSVESSRTAISKVESSPAVMDEKHECKVLKVLRKKKEIIKTCNSLAIG